MRRSVVGPLFLILLGTILLMNNFDLIPWSIWPRLLKLWPLVLVFIGISLVLSHVESGKYHKIGQWLLGGLIIITIALVIAFPQSVTKITDVEPMNMVKKSFSEPLGSLKEADVLLEIGSGNATVSGNGWELIAIDAQYNQAKGDFVLERVGGSDSGTVRYYRNDSVKIFSGIDFTREEHNIVLGNIPMDLNLDLGSGEIRFTPDGTSLQNMMLDVGSGFIEINAENMGMNPVECHQLKVDIGSGRITAYGFGNLNARRFEIEVGSGVGHFETDVFPKGLVSGNLDLSSGVIRLVLPRTVGIKVQGSVGSGGVVIGGHRYDDDYFDDRGTYVSDNYETATSQFDLRVDIGSGRVEIDLI
jgi:hypothetical protein